MGKSLGFEEDVVELEISETRRGKYVVGECDGRHVCVNLEGEQERQCLCCPEMKESTN